MPSSNDNVPVETLRSLLLRYREEAGRDEFGRSLGWKEIDKRITAVSEVDVGGYMAERLRQFAVGLSEEGHPEERHYPSLDPVKLCAIAQFLRQVRYLKPASPTERHRLAAELTEVLRHSLRVGKNGRVTIPWQEETKGTPKIVRLLIEVEVA